MNWWFLKNIKIINSSKLNGGKCKHPTESLNRHWTEEQSVKEEELNQMLELTSHQKSTGSYKGGIFPHRPIGFAVAVHEVIVKLAL